MDEFLGAKSQEQQDGGNSIALFLGLYLLILAFFILLVSISTVEKVKSNAVMDSLSSTFTTLLPPSSDLTDFSAKDGAIIAGKEFQDRIDGIFATALQVARVEIVQPGKEMRVVVPVDSLFLSEKAEIREAQYPLLDRIVATVSSRPPGLRYDLEFVIGVRPIAGRAMPIGQTLEMARAGAFARFMVSRGVPPASISIGLSPDTSTDVVIWFHVRGENETRLRFLSEDEEEATGEAAAEEAAPEEPPPPPAAPSSGGASILLTPAPADGEPTEPVSAPVPPAPPATQPEGAVSLPLPAPVAE